MFDSWYQQRKIAHKFLPAPLQESCEKHLQEKLNKKFMSIHHCIKSNYNESNSKLNKLHHEDLALYLLSSSYFLKSLTLGYVDNNNVK